MCSLGVRGDAVHGQMLGSEEENEKSAIVNHFRNLVVDVDNFSQVGWQRSLMRMVESSKGEKWRLDISPLKSIYLQRLGFLSKPRRGTGFREIELKLYLIEVVVLPQVYGGFRPFPLWGMPLDATAIICRPLKDLNGIPGAKDLIVRFTGYQPHDRDDILTMVGLMSAQFSKPLVASKVTHLDRLLQI